MWHLYRAQRSDALARDLAGVLATPPGDPFAREIVAVPTKGVERWLAQQLSHVLGAGAHADGVCALVEFPSPARVVAEALTVASGFDADTDPWRQAALTWSVLEVLDSVLDQSWALPLRRHLAGPDAADWRRGRRYALASKVAALLAGYADERPSMMLGWLEGRDDDGAGETVPADLLWQPALLRVVRERVGEPGPAERLQAACERLVSEPTASALPDRLSIFGPTRLSTAQLQVLAALAQRRELYLWLPHPSPALWRRVAALGPPAGATTTTPVRRRDDPAREVARHPLLRSLARDARELQQRLATVVPGDSVVPTDSGGSEPVSRPASTLLGRVQAALAADEPPSSARLPFDAGDLSLEVHSCHGRARQVEVLREVVLHKLQADPGLEPREILVMCPQIEVFAPLLSAVLGLDGEGGQGDGSHPGQQLRVSLADRSVRQTNQVLAVLDRVLDLAAGRLPVSAVRDLVSLSPVRRRFGLDTDDVELLETWVEAAAVRWGLDLDHRAGAGLGSVGQGTWQVGLDRIVLGIAVSEYDGAQIGHALPLDGIDSKRAELAGRFAELVARLGDIVRGMASPQPLEQWLQLLEQVLTNLCDTAGSDAWMLVAARSALADVAVAGAAHQTLALSDVRALLGELLAGRPTRTSFRTGSLTVCTMMPMRSVPHRVVILLGLDEQSFPRGEGTDGDDVLLREPWVGERDRRSEDRQLLCDALCAASDAVVVLYSGRDERTNDALAPAVPVAELLDTVDAMVDCGPGGARERLVVQQPLQPFDPSCFVPGQYRPTVPFSHDTTALAGACAARAPRAPVPALVGSALPLEPMPQVDLDDLLRWGDDPARELVRYRLGVGLVEADELPLDEVLVEMDALQAWGVGDRLLSDRLRGLSQAEAAGTEWLRGLLPPGRLGARIIEKQGEKVEQVFTAATPWRGLPVEQLDVDLQLPSGRRLTGSLGLKGSTLLAASTSSLKAKVRWRAWVQLLALAAARPDVEVDAVCIGGGTSAYLPPGPGDALARLDDVVELMVESRSRRMPLPTATGYVYAQRAMRMSPAVALEGARGEWWNDRYERGECTDRFVAALWGVRPPIEVLLDGALADDPASELAVLSLRRWRGLLEWQRGELPSPVPR